MSGFKNDVVYAKNADFTSANNLSPSESNGLATNGQIWTGTTAVNPGGTHVNVGQMVSPDSSITFGYTSPNITAIVNTAVVRDLHTAQYIVSPSGATAGANFTTIQSAIDAAFAFGGGIVAIQEASYTENLTLRPGVNLTAFNGGGSTPKVTIIGKATFTEAGTVTISNVRLQTNADNFLAVTGSAASVVNLNNCYLNHSNATGITFSSSSASAQVYCSNCTGNLGTTGIALYTHTSAGNIFYVNCFISNSGGSITASNNSSGSVFLIWSNISAVFTTSSTGSTTFSYSTISASNTAALTTAGTGASVVEYSRFESGTASSISVGAGTTVNIRSATLNSSNTNAITGAGSVVTGEITYLNSSGNNVTTKSALVTEFGIEKSTLQPAFSAFASGTLSNVTGDGTTYTIICATEVFDQNSEYNTGTGVFTASFTSRYQFNCGLGINGLTAAFTSGTYNLITSNRNYFGSKANYGAMRDGVDLDLGFSALADMDVGDTATLQLTVSGSTKTIGIRTGAPDAYTFFSGYMFC